MICNLIILPLYIPPGVVATIYYLASNPDLPDDIYKLNFVGDYFSIIIV